MQFRTLPFIALFVAGALASPTEYATHDLEARADCSRILPACNGGHVTGQTNCRCRGQKETCDVWQCPGNGANTVVSLAAGVHPLATTQTPSGAVTPMKPTH